MFEKISDATEVNPSERIQAVSPSLHVAIFDLGSKAFASASYDDLRLLVDEDLSSQATVSKRIESFNRRHVRRHDLPPLKVMGFVPTDNPAVITAAAQPAYEHRIDFRRFTLRRYDFEGLYRALQVRNDTDQATDDTKAIASAFDHISELKRFR